jgi:NAD+ synthetase
MNYRIAVNNIREELKNYIQDHNIQSLVLGISGGMDSCLCAALAKPICDELNIPLIGRSLPIATNEQDEIDRANLTGKVFCTDFKEVNLNQHYEALSLINSPQPFESLPINVPVISTDFEESRKSWKIRNGNIKARLRMMFLYNLASMTKGMVLSTDNYTEYMLGFWTLHGDVGDYGMIQELWKSEVYDMAEWIAKNECKSIDESTALTLTIEALATDGLGVTNMGDLGQIMPDWKGTSRDGYKEVDKILSSFVKRSTFEMASPLDEKDPVIGRHLKSEFKRGNPVNIKRNFIFPNL